MAGKNILVVEDEADIGKLIKVNLEGEGFRVTLAETGEEGLSELASGAFDLVILDLMLPGIDGYEVCRRMRGNPDTDSVPVVMLTAKGEESDIVAGLETGADDYITKPFSPKVLVARIKTVLRRDSRKVPIEGPVVEVHGIRIDPGRHEVRVKDKSVELTHSEFKILHLLASRPGWVFTRYQIVDRIHGEDYAVTDRAVDVQVVGLRKKLGKAGVLIETVRGVGYRFKDR